MKILEIADSAVALDSGAHKSVNEVIWNYRSGCCGVPLDLAGGLLVCAQCGLSDDLDVVHKSIIANTGIQIAEVINALPEDSRDRGTKGFYRAIDDPSIKIVHVFDIGGEYEPFELPQEMRR